MRLKKQQSCAFDNNPIAQGSPPWAIAEACCRQSGERFPRERPANREITSPSRCKCRRHQDAFLAQTHTATYHGFLITQSQNDAYGTLLIAKRQRAMLLGRVNLIHFIGMWLIQQGKTAEGIQCLTAAGTAHELRLSRYLASSLSPRDRC